MLGGLVVVPVIDVSRAVVKGNGLQRAAVNSPTVFRVSTKASGEAELDVTVTGGVTQVLEREKDTFNSNFMSCKSLLWYLFSVFIDVLVMNCNLFHLVKKLLPVFNLENNKDLCHL